MSRFEDQVTAALAEHDFFEVEQPIRVARAPGRLDVLGGNVDYTGGLVLQALLREAIWVAAQPRKDTRIRILNPGAANFGWETNCEIEASSLCNPCSIRCLCTQREGLGWATYVLGSLHFLKQTYPESCAGGIDLFIASDLPPNKGVSSSAALEVATLKAASEAWGVILNGIALATAGQWVENVVVGSACGIMDQAAIVMGRDDHLLPLLCQPCSAFSPIGLPPGTSIWGIDSMVPRSTTGEAYESARVAAFMGYKLISQRLEIDVVPDKAQEIPRWTDSRWDGYLSKLAPSEFRARYERWLPESLHGSEFLARAGEHVDPFTKIDPKKEYPVRAAVRYASEENFRVQLAVSLLESVARNATEDSLRLIGEIFCQSHVAYSDCGLGSEACDELVERALGAGFFGAKMTGGGAGGVVAVLGRSADRNALWSVAKEFGAARDAIPHVLEGSSSGVDAFGVRTLKLSALEEAR